VYIVVTGQLSVHPYKQDTIVAKSTRQKKRNNEPLSQNNTISLPTRSKGPMRHIEYLAVGHKAIKTSHST